MSINQEIIDNSIDDWLKVMMDDEDMAHCHNILKDEIKNNISKIDNISRYRVESLPYLSSRIIEPKRWEKEISRKQRNIERTQNITTMEILCSKCKGTRGSMKMQQTASGDEPMTSFITCLDCGFTFRK